MQHNYIQVQRAQGYSNEQAYLMTVNSGYTKNRKADDAMLKKVKAQYHKKLVVESQIPEMRSKLLEMASEVNKDFPKCKPVQIGEVGNYSDYGVQCIYFGGSEARLEFEEINPLYWTDWIACV